MSNDVVLSTIKEYEWVVQVVKFPNGEEFARIWQDGKVWGYQRNEAEAWEAIHIYEVEAWM